MKTVKNSLIPSIFTLLALSGVLYAEPIEFGEETHAHLQAYFESTTSDLSPEIIDTLIAQAEVQLKNLADGANQVDTETVEDVSTHVLEAYRKQHTNQPAQQENVDPAQQKSQEADDAALALLLHDQELADFVGDSLALSFQPAVPVETPYGQGIELPQSLGQQDVYQLQSLNQFERAGNGLACGNYAVYNIAAIHRLLSNQQQLTTQKIQQEVNKLIETFNTGSWLETGDIGELANDLEVPIIHIFHIVDKSTQSAGEIGSLTLHDHTNTQLISLDASTEIFYAICNTGNHWVAAAVIKKNGQKPVILYLNSSNSPVQQDDHAYLFLEYLRTHIK